MVVKQSEPTHHDEPLQESRMFKQLNTSNSTHFDDGLGHQNYRTFNTHYWTLTRILTQMP